MQLTNVPRQSPRTWIHLAVLIQNERICQVPVRFIEGTGQIEATVYSFRDATNTRKLVMSSEQQTPPACCVYSIVSDGFLYWHGTAMLFDKYGIVRYHQFIGQRNLSTRWKEQYDGISFKLQCQADVDRVLLDSQDAIHRGECMNVPKALAPQFRRPL